MEAWKHGSREREGRKQGSSEISKQGSRETGSCEAKKGSRDAGKHGNIGRMNVEISVSTSKNAYESTQGTFISHRYLRSIVNVGSWNRIASSTNWKSWFRTVFYDIKSTFQSCYKRRRWRWRWRTTTFHVTKMCILLPRTAFHIGIYGTSLIWA